MGSCEVLNHCYFLTSTWFNENNLEQVSPQGIQKMLTQYGNFKPNPISVFFSSDSTIHDNQCIEGKRKKPQCSSLKLLVSRVSKLEISLRKQILI